MRITLISAIAAGALTLAACGSDSASTGDVCAAPTETSTVEMADFSYAPECASVAAGTSLEVRNVGEAPHTYTVNETDIDVQVEAGASTTIELAGVAAGTYEVVCTLHPQMEGALQVA